MAVEPRLYDDLAPWWPLLSAPEDYEEEARIYGGALREACAPREILELGSGGGNNACHLKRDFGLTLVDRSPGMLEVSRSLNPECHHIQGDMRDVRLERQFDAVLIHDAIMYLASEEDLVRAVRTAYEHCRPGGCALFVPDYVKETFQESTHTGGHDGEGRSLRYLSWTHDPDPEDDTFIVDFAILLREDGQKTCVVQDRHTMGLFARERWLELCRGVGFTPEIREVTYTDPIALESEMILARR